VKHIDSLSELKSVAVDKAAFYASLRSGMLLFVSGKEPISHAIEKCTHSPWSHIGMVYMPCFDDGTPVGIWMLIEAVYPHGVGTNPLGTYIEGPDDLVLVKRVDLLGADIDQRPAIRTELSLSGRDYAAFGLVREGLHRLDHYLPAEWNTQKCYCSGMQWLGSLKTTRPFPAPNGAPAPEDEWVDASVVAVCALLKGVAS
jgi:hypothetical protein